MSEWPDSVLEYDRLRSYLSDEDVGAYPRSADTAISDLKKMVNELRDEAKSANEQADCEAERAALWAKKAQKLEKALASAIEEWQHGEIPPDGVQDFLTLHPEWR